MKIGIDCRLWNETGVGRYIRALVDNLNVLGQNHEYYLFLRKREYETLTLPENFHKVKAQISWHSLEEQLKLPGLFREHDLDLIHVPYFSVPVFTPRPFVFTLHDLTISRFATGRASSRSLPIYFLKRLAYKQVLYRAILNSTKIIVPSVTVKKQLVAHYPDMESKTEVIYESGELEDENKSGQPPLNNYLLYVGNAHPHKNLEKLISAFEILSTQLPDLNLALIGKMDFFYTKLEKYIKDADLDRKIKIYSGVGNGSLNTWYKNAKALVFPSLSEGFGIPGLEAMRQACPVIASDIDVFHEIYGAAAMYFDPNDHQDIADKIKLVLTETKLRSELLEKGMKKAQEYSWARMAIATLKIYESCIGL